MESVSIVIPTYNRAHLITKGVKSVLKQTYQNFEIIIVDDGSVDHTEQIVKAIATVEPRVKYIKHETNKGAQAARNTGIKAAQGEWIAFLDSDDLWLPHSLEARLEYALKANLKVVHSECRVIEVNGTIRTFGVPPLSGNIYNKILAEPGPMFQGLLVAKEALEKIGYLDEAIISYQEWDTSIRLAKFYQFGFLAEPTFIYDCRGADSMSKNILKDAQGYKQVFTKHFLEILKHNGPYDIAKHYSFTGYRYRSAEDYNNLFCCQLMSLFWWPFAIKKLFYKSI